MNEQIDLSSEYELSEAQIEAFRQDGHVYLPNVCLADEVAYYRQAISDTAWQRFPQDKRTDRPFLQTLNLRYHCPKVMQFVLAPRLGKIVSDLISKPTASDPDRQPLSVRIFHEQALFKEPKGGLTPWHQDQYYWPLATEYAVGLWMPLVDVPLEMGPIRFATGSHRRGFVKQVAISEQSQDFFQQFIEDQGYPIWQREMRAGDATLHNGWTIHGATANQTDQMRSAMIVTYYPNGTKVDQLSNPSRVNDAKHFLGGKQAGDLADSQMNTIVYQAS